MQQGQLQVEEFAAMEEATPPRNQQQFQAQQVPPPWSEEETRSLNAYIIRLGIH